MHLRALQELLGYETVSNDTEVLLPGSGKVTECSQAAGWSDLGKAGIGVLLAS